MPGQFPTIGLALSGGAARGNAHVGVLRALVENKIPVDYVAGTSAGSLVGGALASGMPIDEIEDLGRRMRWRDIGRMTMSRRLITTTASTPFSRICGLPTRRCKRKYSARSTSGWRLAWMASASTLLR